MTFSQAEFEIRCEWGGQGIAELAPISDAIIIVDVMSFTTCVSVATARGAVVHPWCRRDPAAADHARSIGAELAGPRDRGGYSLSPTSLLSIPAETRLVLPSPNGATLSLATGRVPTFAGCLRNAEAVARAAAGFGKHISVIPAGERWKTDGSLRPAIEDLIGAGAVLHYLAGRFSPEAEVAHGAFLAAATGLLRLLGSCSSGRELVALGFSRDLPVIADMNADACAPRLQDGAYSAG